MDFLKILRSFEEFLFEAMTWLLFYPLTLWRTVAHPLGTTAYSNREQDDDAEARYDDAISPPLFLLFTLILTNLVAVALHVTPPPGSSASLRLIEASPQNLVLFRSLAFSLAPLIASTTLLRSRRVRLSRESLRPPFYAQCYLVSPLAMAFSAGGLIYQRADVPNGWGLAVMIAATVWFVVAETRWFALELQVSIARAAIKTAAVLFATAVYFVALALPIALL